MLFREYGANAIWASSRPWLKLNRGVGVPAGLPGAEQPATMRGMGKTKTSSLVDTRVIYCGDNLERLKELSRYPHIHQMDAK